ncbi:MAG TPA: hypothetical protein VK420_12780 [Longimicrobium sp.]|nr:hypothetical protein [Longimicrobium sp.]
MRISKWFFAAGLLSSGLAFAGDDWDNTKGEAKQEAREFKSDVKGAGKDVRTGYEADKKEMKRDLREVKEDAKDVVQGVGDTAASGAEKVGSGVGDAIREGTDAVAGSPSELPRGQLEEKTIRNTVTTNPLGLVTGDGLNVEYSRPVFGEKISAVGMGRLARSRFGDGSVTNLGLGVGADWFIIGQNNEGLRIGPRIDLGLGGVTGTEGDNGAFGSLGAGGEVGYNWIASNGFTAGAAAGLSGRLAGRTERTDSYSNATFGPYGKLNLGYSW